MSRDCLKKSRTKRASTTILLSSIYRIRKLKDCLNNGSYHGYNMQTKKKCWALGKKSVERHQAHVTMPYEGLLSPEQSQQIRTKLTEQEKAAQRPSCTFRHHIFNLSHDKKTRVLPKSPLAWEYHEKPCHVSGIE